MDYSNQFIRAKNFTLSAKIEGGLSTDPEDDGNWTGGKKGAGTLAGTKYGISAAAYPSIDIASLRFEDAVAIYYRDYWNPIRGDELPPRLSLAVFDSAVNQGVDTAIRLLQQATGVEVDGKLGPQTLAASRNQEPEDTLVDFVAARMLRYTKSKNFDRYSGGWYRRAIRSAIESIR